MSNGQWAGYDKREKRPERRVIFVSGDTVTSYRIRPWIAAPLALLCGVFALTYLAATAYLIYRDDLISVVMNHNVRSVRAYEDRIALLRAEVDRVSSRQILDQASFEDKIDQLLSRQDALNDRQRLVATLIDQARRDGLEILPTSAPAGDGANLTTGSLPAVATAYAAPTGSATNAFAGLLSGASPAPAQSEALRVDGSDTDLAVIALDLGRMTLEQTAAVETIATTAEAKIDDIQAVAATVGLSIAADDPEEDVDAMGGPYIPAGAGGLQVALDEAQSALARLASVREAATELPVAAPIPGATRTSRFGSRRDPFLGRRAFHAGIDFRSPTGTPVHPSGSGRVVFAGRNGGYGNMVEIDHGDGITTRYAHMSAIEASVGDAVTRDTVIGRVGSTGRSTGPHLHYETRVNGTATDPNPYLDAGQRLAALL
jgi:murein DD-endopeptidase MepM/ murein hydrolase activator NlpD